MPTALLRLSAPLQSYGLHSCWDHHTTAPRPTKSAVTGLIANALGWERDADLRELADLVFSVRADRPGRITTDHQIAGGGRFPRTALTASRPNAATHPDTYGVPRAPHLDNTATPTTYYAPSLRAGVLITKEYLADAAFVVGLTTPDPALAEQILAAVRRPHRLLYLGRRCCPPSRSISHGLTDDDGDTWPGHLPLLPEATTPTPTVWTQTPPGPGSVGYPEQPPTTFTRRDHRTVHLRTTVVRPPAPTTPEQPR
ncbi:type I-E CRISPR-associated protein Cas5/CasD [Kitasatospora sp. NPDC058201]|uniref:type I-E CRISPR-associated protein Cas5/CasD n=1 Tax=unclassified Kitasatospora TaxID=2633591 RepID=UPI00366161E1